MAYVSRFTFLGTFSFSVFSYLLPLFCHFTAFLFRLRKGDGSLEKSFDFSETHHTSEEFNDAVELMDHMNEDEEEKGTYFDFDFDFSEEVLFQQSGKEKEWLVTDSGSALSTGYFEHMSRPGDSYNDGFLSYEDFEFDSFKDLGGEDNVIFHHPEFLSESDFHDEEDDDIIPEELKNAEDLGSGDLNKWEHQELIEQLQSELRKVRTNSLPTILEESESPEKEEEEDWKPWKNVEQSFQPDEDYCMAELQTFYNAYRERMRRFDILTYQKMYAIGFLQKGPLKDPLQLLSTQKSSSLKSLLFPQNIWLFKHKNRGVDPMMTRFIKELRRDLEAVYVGQMCLSWEILHWQYVKALDLWGSDPRSRINRYNEASEEFQQFMALMQRFIEDDDDDDDEPFQGTRVQHYIRCRCDFRSLLQVPLIKGNNKFEPQT